MVTALFENTLLLAAREGDNDAFEQLQARFEGQVRRFVRHLIGSSDAEDDIVQNIFIALYYNLHRIEPIEKFRPYLFRIARNCCYDELRAQGRYDAVPFDEEPDDGWIDYAADCTPAPDDLAHWTLLHVEVVAAMDRLPEVQRQTLILYAEEGLSYGEIAIALNTNIGTVKSRLFHAKRMLRSLLNPGIVQALERELGGNHVGL
jgi:RNA polymerase sigma-70 factor (ECF subfamily)